MFYVLLLSILAGLFSTLVMSYISMATAVGPWIAPVLVLIGFLLFRCRSAQANSLSLVYMTVSGSVGGILATAFGFSFPTLYFLDPELYLSYSAQPVFFISFVSILAFVAALYGMWIANLFQSTFLSQENIPFPVAQVMCKLVCAYDQMAKACEMAVGFIGSMVFSLLQDGVQCFFPIIPKVMVLSRAVSFFNLYIPAIEIELWPMLWAIGFITGRIIIVPLVVGALLKIFFVSQVHEFYFGATSQAEFLLAFCSGMVLAGALQIFSLQSIKALCTYVKSIFKQKQAKDFVANPHYPVLLEGLLVIIVCVGFLSYIKCSVLLQIYLLIGTFICTYQVIMLTGKIGLAQLGRFATFVLMPALLLFDLDVMQIVVISTFVEAAAGVGADVMSGRKFVQLVNGSRSVARRYQYLGIIVSCVAIGLIFWLLTSAFKLGSPELFAQRSQARYLLVSVKQFDFLTLVIGLLTGMALKLMRLNLMMVFGGLLMPLNIVLALVMGSVGAAVCKDRDWYPFWSGVFTAQSIWMVIKALV